MAAEPRSLLKRLFEYIGEQLKDIDPKGFQLHKHSNFLQVPADIAGLPGVRTDVRQEGDHVWLQVDRLEAGVPPKVPEQQRDYLVVDGDPNSSPPSVQESVIKRRIAALAQNKPEQERPAIEAQMRAAADRALLAYTPLWLAWAEGEKPRRKTIALYGDLFALKHQIESQETAKPTELVWGIGVAVWKLAAPGEGSFPFSYPLLTQAVEIALEEQSMMLSVRPRATDTRVEMDAFVACQIKGASEVEKSCRDHLGRTRERPVSPFDSGSYSDIMKLAATNLDSKGVYREVLATQEALPVAGDHLVVTDMWALFARPRAQNYLVADLAAIQAKLASGCEIPAGPLALVSNPSDTPIEFEPIHYRGISSRGAAPSGSKSPELFFPLPYNDEQVTIVQRLERAAGVTVQGPPGTGKTHTIANIICHYLALGRRVLVTSKGEPALKVLQEKIPEEIRPLTVALLTNDREGVRQFQASIEAIQHRVSQLDPFQVKLEIEERLSSIDQVHAQLVQIDTKIDEIAIAQLSDVEVDGTPMRAQKLAEFVVSGKEQYGWFDDLLTLAAAQMPPLAQEEAAQLRSSRRKLKADLIYVGENLPSAADLPTPNQVADLHATLGRIKRIDSKLASGGLLPLRSATPEVLDAARQLLASLDEAKALAEELESVEGGWPLETRKKCLNLAFKSEREALEALFPDLDTLIDARKEFLKRPIALSDAALRSSKVRQAIERAAESGKPFGLITVGVGDSKAQVAAIKISGLTPVTAEEWTHVQRYMLLHDKVTSFLARWNQVAQAFSIPALSGGVAILRDLEITGVTSRQAHRLAVKFDAVLPRQAERVFEKAPISQICGSSEDIESVRAHLLQHLSRADLAQATTNLFALRAKLSDKTGPISEGLKSFVSDTLGNLDIESQEAASTYAELTTDLRRIASLSVDLATVQDLTRRLELAGAPRFSMRLQTLSVAESGEDHAFPVTWREAWTWARVSGHLEEIEGREELLALASRRRDLEAGLARLYREVVANAAWLATKRNASPLVLQALAGYAVAIRRIGQGTGPNAIRYRRDAQESMLQAAGAVPCWIMSHAKISESMPPDIGAFDLVIVDEASQSDLWALPAIVRGKKILVVGDDKQVSPNGGFIASEHIQTLRDRFLADQPYGVEMTPEKSLYDLAARVFAAEQVMLREHFRCVPPIIAYSNARFYKGGIQPLRIPRASERIDPPLVDIYVEGGMRDRRDLNRNEALAIADEIEAILADEQFQGRTIGVVSLLGPEQAKFIDAEVRRRCSASELLRRRFACGDASTFQGSERHIMFLSLVADPGSAPLSGQMFDQRFNVAASRAQDRMYLVRSVETTQLSDRDLRQTLLDHFSKPLVPGAKEADELINLCESGFEKDVFLELTKRGYYVIPQVKTGAYRLDMVVEGAADARLAIECDGDEFHGPDRWPHDTRRQRVLERAGWTFWRCFASTWTLRRAEVLQELVDRLTAMGIEPLGALACAPSLVEKRIWRAPQKDVDDAPRSAVAARSPTTTRRPASTGRL
jgi:very-short-patch-repair endonuclease